jgi:hypothetical protein
VCDACNLQAFARSDRSDEKLRALLLDGKPEPVATAPAPPSSVVVMTPPNKAAAVLGGQA